MWHGWRKRKSWQMLINSKNKNTQTQKEKQIKQTTKLETYGGIYNQDNEYVDNCGRIDVCLIKKETMKMNEQC